MELVDDDGGLCFLCGEALPPVPEGVEPKEYYWVFGFADGVQTAVRGEGYQQCDKHRAMIRAALLERGINWGKPDKTFQPDSKKLII